MIAVTLLNMIVNMGVMLWKTIQRIRMGILKLKKKYLLWKMARAKKYEE